MNRRFLGMLREVRRFHRTAGALLHDPDHDETAGVTLGDFLIRNRFSDYFAQHFALPLVAPVWSSGTGDELARFRADPERRGTVLSTGLWRFTRHPNYFGDACVWWGLYLCACSALPRPAPSPPRY